MNDQKIHTCANEDCQERFREKLVTANQDNQGRWYCSRTCCSAQEFREMHRRLQSASSVAKRKQEQAKGRDNG